MKRSLRQSLFWNLLTINLVVVGIAVAVAALTIGRLADAIFTRLMQDFHIQVDVMHRLFVADMTRSLVLASVIAGVVGVLLSVLFFRKLVAPVRGMMTLAEQIAAGDYAARARVTRSDEVGRLADSLNRMAAALAELERLRKELVANVAHELRTPLTNLQGYLEAIHDGVAPASLETMATLHGETMRLVRLVNALHELSLFDARLPRFHPLFVDVDGLIRRLIALRSADFTGKGITVHTDLQLDGPVLADPDLLAQAVSNLLDNAVKYTHASGEVTVRAASGGNDMRIAVANTGEEIAPDDLPHIFERFYRGEKSRSRESGGAGIGLSIVQEVARVHGGQAGAESRNGLTTIWLTVPRHA